MFCFWLNLTLDTVYIPRDGRVVARNNWGRMQLSRDFGKQMKVWELLMQHYRQETCPGEVWFGMLREIFNFCYFRQHNIAAPSHVRWSGKLMFGLFAFYHIFCTEAKLCMCGRNMPGGLIDYFSLSDSLISPHPPPCTYLFKLICKVTGSLKKQWCRPANHKYLVPAGQPKFVRSDKWLYTTP